MRELQERMGSREFAEWIAYDELNPFGEERADLRMGIMASAFANANRGKGQDAFKPSDFMPEFGKLAGPKRTVEEEWMVLMAFTRRHNKGQAKKRGDA